MRGFVLSLTLRDEAVGGSGAVGEGIECNINNEKLSSMRAVQCGLGEFAIRAHLNFAPNGHCNRQKPASPLTPD